MKISSLRQNESHCVRHKIHLYVQYPLRDNSSNLTICALVGNFRRRLWETRSSSSTSNA